MGNTKEKYRSEAQQLPTALENRAGFLLNVAARQIREQTIKALTPFRICPRQFAIMTICSSQAPLTQIALGGMLKIDRTTVVALIDGLERQMLVVRKIHPDDRRAYLISLTPHGKERIHATTKRVDEIQKAFLKGLTDKEWIHLRKLITKLILAQPNGEFEPYGDSCS